MKTFLCVSGSKFFSVGKTYPPIPDSETFSDTSTLLNEKQIWTVIDEEGDPHIIKFNMGEWASAYPEGPKAIFEVIRGPKEENWDGRGHPPTDTICEVTPNGIYEGQWFEAKAVGRDGDVTVFRWLGGKPLRGYHAADIDSVRPVKTKAQRDRDELASLVVARGTPEEVANHIIRNGWRKS